MKKHDIKNKCDLNLLAECLENIKTSSGKSKASFSAFVFEDVISVIESYFHNDFDDTITDYEKIGIIRSAVFSAGSKGVITSESIIKEFKRNKAEFKARIYIPFILATSISIPYIAQLKNTRIASNTITFSKVLPSKFSQNDFIKKIKAYLASDTTKFIPNSYTPTRIRVMARTDNEASQIATDTIDYLRGIKNFLINKNISFTLRSGKPKPINKIRLGPIHTLHYPDGSIASKHFWYDPHYFYDPLLNYRNIDWDKIKKEEIFLRNRLKKHPYGSDLKSIFIKYARSLDLYDYESSFLKLWSLLECLTNTNKKNYDTTIRRTAFLYEDRDFHIQVLEHLRAYRNLFVHSDKSTSRVETSIYQLKRYVERAILFHIKSYTHFTTIGEAGEFLNLPFKAYNLKEKISLYKYALNFMGNKYG